MWEEVSEIHMVKIALSLPCQTFLENTVLRKMWAEGIVAQCRRGGWPRAAGKWVGNTKPWCPRGPESSCCKEIFTTPLHTCQFLLCWGHMAQNKLSEVTPAMHEVAKGDFFAGCLALAARVPSLAPGVPSRLCFFPSTPYNFSYYHPVGPPVLLG